MFQGTAFVDYKPNAEKSLVFHLRSVEVFSCCLAAEDETALSIIDPMELTLELNVCQVKTQPRSAGLLDVGVSDNRQPILEV